MDEKILHHLCGCRVEGLGFSFLDHRFTEDSGFGYRRVIKWIMEKNMETTI